MKSQAVLGRVILKLDNKNQKLFLCSDHSYVKLNSKELLLFDRNPKMPRKLVKVDLYCKTPATNTPLLMKARGFYSKYSKTSR